MSTRVIDANSDGANPGSLIVRLAMAIAVVTSIAGAVIVSAIATATPAGVSPCATRCSRTARR